MKSEFNKSHIALSIETEAKRLGLEMYNLFSKPRAPHPRFILTNGKRLAWIIARAYNEHTPKETSRLISHLSPARYEWIKKHKKTHLIYFIIGYKEEKEFSLYTAKAVLSSQAPKQTDKRLAPLIHTITGW